MFYKHISGYGTFSASDILFRIINSLKSTYLLAKNGINLYPFCPNETIYMKCRGLFSVKNKKYISKCYLLKFFPSMLSVNTNYYAPSPENARAQLFKANDVVS